MIERAGQQLPARLVLSGDYFRSFMPDITKSSRHSIERLEQRIAPAFAPVLELSNLTGLNGFQLNGVSAEDYAGSSVSNAGDINGDGLDDIVVGARWADSNGQSRTGASYIVFGRTTGFGAALDLNGLNGTNGFTITGADEGDYAGFSVSSAGDVNGDGISDLVIGGHGVNSEAKFRSGATYIVFGKTEGFPSVLNLATLNGVNGFAITGTAAGDYSGYSVSGAGDVNGDGFDDVLIGAYGEDRNGTYSGAAYVVFGQGTLFPANLPLAALNGTNGFRLSGSTSVKDEHIGFGVSGVGDINGDDLDDLIIRGHGYGNAYVVYGKRTPFAAQIDLSQLDGTTGFVITNYAGGASGVGDFNGDGFDDLVIGHGGADSGGKINNGAAYLVFGSPNLGAVLDLATLSGPNGFRVNGELAGDRFGSVSGAGDVNGDSFADIIIGAGGADPGGKSEAGSSYVIFGGSGLFPATFNASTLNGANGFKINGEAVQDFAGLVSSAGDLNHDGFDDLIIGAPNADTRFGFNSGAAYVVFGDGIEMRINDVAVDEGDSGVRQASFTVNLSEPAVSQISVKLNTMNGTATGGADFTALNNAELVFAPGEFTKTVTVQIINESLFEGDETFTLSLSNAIGALVVDGTGVATVRNDDAPPLVSVSAASVIEGDAGTSAMQFTVTLSTPSGLPATVHYATSDLTATAGSDYQPLSGQLLTFAPGEMSKTFTVEVNGETAIESDEQLAVVLSEATQATFGNANAIGTILNDDAAIQITNPAPVIEGNLDTTPLIFQVTLQHASAFPVTVAYAAMNGSATAESDYSTIAPGTLTFAPGETTKAITVQLVGDNIIEDHETFSIALSSPTNGVLANDTATATILNDDTAVEIADSSGIEGDIGPGAIPFTIQLLKASALPVTVNYSTADGTASSADYEPVIDGQITFAPGETTKSIVVHAVGDTEIESHEMFTVLISSALNAVIADNTALGIILNDETEVSIENVSVLEGHKGLTALTFTVRLSVPTALPVSLSVATFADSGAMAGTDYLDATRSITFAPGETIATGNLSVIGDTTAEGNETFDIAVLEAMNARIGNAHAVAAILDDDVTLRGKRTATFTDVDGDAATIRVNKGKLQVENFILVPSGIGSQLASIDFSQDKEFTRAHLQITGSDGSGNVSPVNVGFIDAHGIDLGKVNISGDLARIVVGQGGLGRPGLALLHARSLGDTTASEQDDEESRQESEVKGSLGKLVLEAGMHGASLVVTNNIGSVQITGTLRDSALHSDGRIGPMRISGDVIGSTAHNTTISARGALSPASSSAALALVNISIGGSINHAKILGGVDRTGTTVNPDARIGAVVVGHNWTASSLVTGADAGPDDLFGTDDDALGSRGTSIAARIASIIIEGAVEGTEELNDHYGFVAEQIGAFRAGNIQLPLTVGPRNDVAGFPLGNQADVKLREIA